MASMTTHIGSEKDRLRVFIPHARILTPEDLLTIPPEEKRDAEAGNEGVWLDVHCPKGKCLSGEHKLTMEVRGVKQGPKGGIWHEIFCPEDRCYAQSYSDLP